MQDALDYLEELIDEEENNTDVPEAIYIEPPAFDGNISGEDDADYDEGGIPDNVCPEQLKASCEIVTSGGTRLDGLHENDDFALGFFSPLLFNYSSMNTYILQIIFFFS